MSVVENHLGMTLLKMVFINKILFIIPEKETINKKQNLLKISMGINERTARGFYMKNEYCKVCVRQCFV